jgi:hypothetical protein
MPTKIKTPTEAELEAVLGPAFPVWTGLIGVLQERFAPLASTWKPSKSEFGRMCLVQQKKRTLLYMTPDDGQVWVAIVLGERAYDLAMASRSIPAKIKKLFSEAKPYAEGRGIRFPVSALREIPFVEALVEIKLTPK